MCCITLVSTRRKKLLDIIWNININSMFQVPLHVWWNITLLQKCPNIIYREFIRPKKNDIQFIHAEQSMNRRILQAFFLKYFISSLYCWSISYDSTTEKKSVHSICSQTVYIGHDMFFPLCFFLPISRQAIWSICFNVMDGWIDWLLLRWWWWVWKETVQFSHNNNNWFSL